MGIQERKEREKEMRRQSILDVAERLFLEGSIVETTMEHIASESEISRGTIYLYFKSKEEILLELTLRSMEALLNSMKENINDNDPIEKQIECIGIAYYNFYKNHRNHFMFMIKMNMDEQKVKMAIDEHKKGYYEEHSYDILEKSGKIWKVIVDVLIRGIKSNYFREDINPLEIAIMLWSASNGALLVLDHISLCHNNEIPHNNSNTESVDEMLLCKHVDMEKVLYDLWSYIINGIRKV